MDIDLSVTLLGAWPSGVIDLLSAVLGSRVKLKGDDAFPSRGLQEVDTSVLVSAAEAAIKVSSYLRGVPSTHSIHLHQINRQLRMDGVIAVEVENCMVGDADTESIVVSVRHRTSGQGYRFESVWDGARLGLRQVTEAQAGLWRTIPIDRRPDRSGGERPTAAAPAAPIPRAEFLSHSEETRRAEHSWRRVRHSICGWFPRGVS